MSSPRTTSRFDMSAIMKLSAFSVIGYCSYLVYQKHKKKQKLRAVWKNKNIARISDVTLNQILDLFSVALNMQQLVLSDGVCKFAANKLLITMFYEPSTRTSTSFQAAMLRLGGKVINISDVKSSSVSKGETLEDTMRCLQCYTDVLVIRHPQKGTPDRIISALSSTANPIPILNAGDGSGEHPTQALLDLFTMYKEKNYNINGLTITFVGDLKYGRTVHSLVPALLLFKDISFNFVSPKQLQIPQYIKKGIDNYKESTDLSVDILSATDVLYVTRIQKERFKSLEEYNKVKGCFVIDMDVLKNCKSDMIVMHPLPRVDEIAMEVDNDERAVYFKQMEYGMYVRMALLALVLGVY